MSWLAGFVLYKECTIYDNVNIGKLCALITTALDTALHTTHPHTGLGGGGGECSL